MLDCLPGRWALIPLFLTIASCSQATSAADSTTVDSSTAADDTSADATAGDMLSDVAADSTASDTPGAPDDGPDAPDTAELDTAQPDTGESDIQVCVPGTTSCEGIKLATCLGDGGGYSVSPCYPGNVCESGKCVPVGANLIIAFDTSGSMSEDVLKPGGGNNCSSGYNVWPKCEYQPQYGAGCTRIGVSKTVFKQALAKLDDQVTRLALFKFPQTLGGSFSSCDSGQYNGQETMTGDKGTDQDVSASTAWFDKNLKEILCVSYPAAKGFDSTGAMTKWMDGTENKTNDPELRADGGTPIGKTLFYVGEYLRNYVIVDGKACSTAADCGSVNYVCTPEGVCTDPARSCRETVVVLFTDGGESSSLDYFGPWVQAKRMTVGLGCQTDSDCANGATCKNVGQCTKTGTGWLGSKESVDDKPCASDLDCGTGGKCTMLQECMVKGDPSGLSYFCSDGGKVCDPLASSNCTSTDPNKPCKLDTASALYCPAQCVRDPRAGVYPKTAIAKSSNHVLRSPDGKPFGVRLFVVDIGSTTGDDIRNSWRLAMSGNGRLLGANASDPTAFLSVLDSAFDLKNKKVCGVAN